MITHPFNWIILEVDHYYLSQLLKLIVHIYGDSSCEWPLKCVIELPPHYVNKQCQVCILSRLESVWVYL